MIEKIYYEHRERGKMICYFICKFMVDGKYAKQIDQLLSTKYTNLFSYVYGGIGERK